MSLNLRKQLHTERKLFHTRRLLRRDAAQQVYIAAQQLYIVAQWSDDLMSDKYITFSVPDLLRWKQQMVVQQKVVLQNKLLVSLFIKNTKLGQHPF